jgi:hypothetical protein
MPTLRYALEENGPRQLELSWEGQYQQFTVKLDDQVVGQVPDRKALLAGHRLPLPDGSTLELRTVGTALANELRVLRNGRPVPGSASDPALRLRTAYQLIFFIAAVNLLGGLVAGLLRVEFLTQLGLGWGSLIFGAVYLALGLLVRQRSAFALIMTVALYGFETIMGLLVPVLITSRPNVAGLIVRLTFLWVLLQGFPALRQLRQVETPAATREPAKP